MEKSFKWSCFFTKLWYNIRKPLICFLFIAGILLIAACYYTLFFLTGPSDLMLPPAYNPAPGKKDFRITVFSDWLLASGPIEKIAAEAASRQADFAVCLGDFVHPAQPSILRLAIADLKKNFKIPVYATPGNHDVYNAEDAAAFSGVFGNVNNCFAHGDTLFILLNSASTELTGEQLQFLKFLLDHERPKYRRCILFSHVPPITIPELDRRKYRLSKENAAELQKIVDGKIDMMICGHAHHEMDLKWGKTRLLVVPPSGQWSRNPNNKQFGSLQLHFKEDGSIVPEFVYCGLEQRENKLRYFVYRRLNQRSIFFCIGIGLIICGAVLSIAAEKKTSHFPNI